MSQPIGKHRKIDLIMEPCGVNEEFAKTAQPILGRNDYSLKVSTAITSRGYPSVDKAIDTESIDRNFAFAERDQFTNDLANSCRMLEAVTGARGCDHYSIVTRVEIDHEVGIRRCGVKTSGRAVAYGSKPMKPISHIA